MSLKPDPWIRLYNVSESQLHPKGYTVYKICSTVFPRNSPEAATEVVVWRRFSDIKKLYKSLHAIHAGLHLKGEFPDFPKAKVFGRFEPAVIEERRQSTLCLLEFVDRYPPLFTSNIFVKFFEGGRRNCIVKEEEKAEAGATTDQVLHPVKVGCRCAVVEDGTLLCCNGDDNPSLLGGVWQYPRSPDDVSLDSKEEDEDDDKNEEGGVSMGSSVVPPSPIPKAVLALFDPLSSDEQRPSSSHPEPKNSWLLSALASCTNLEDVDTFSRLAPFEFPKAFEGDGEWIVQSGEPSEAKDTRVARVGEIPMLPSTDGTLRATLEMQNRYEGRATTLPVDHTHLEYEGDTREDYLVEAAHVVTRAQQSEAEGDLEAAFDHYKGAVGILLSGVREDLDSARRSSVRRKIAQYLQRAEEICRWRQLSNHGDQLPAACPLLSCNGVMRDGNWKASTPIDSLARYKVLGVLGKVLLVLDASTNLTFVVKVLAKSSRPSNSSASCVVPLHLPHVVQLIRFHETEDSIFLVLQHAVGGRLWNYVGSYLCRGSDGAVGQDPATIADLEGVCAWDENNIYAGKKLFEGTWPTTADSVKKNLFERNVEHRPSAELSAAGLDCSPGYVDLFTDYIASTPTEGRVFLAECQFVPSLKLAPHNIRDSYNVEATGEKVAVTASMSETLKMIPWSSAAEGDDDEHSSWLNLEKVNAEELICKAQRLMEHVDETLRESNRVNHLMARDASSDEMMNLEASGSRCIVGVAGHDCRTMQSPLRTLARRSSDASHRRLYKQMSNDAFASPVHDGHPSGRRSSASSLDLQRGSRMRHFSAVFRQLDEAGGPSPGLPESCIRVWAAEIVGALSALHSEGIVCKDLKPDNILLGERGHVLLSYFGRWPSVEASIDPTAKALLYSAPEVGGIFEVTAACDWWSLGVLLFELLTGKTLISLYPGGLTSHSQLHLPCRLSDEAESLLKGLLCYNPIERLGSEPQGVENIKAHPFFQGVDWRKPTT